MYRKNAWNKYSDKKAIFDFNEGYKDYLTNCKTERLAVKFAIEQLEKAGFKNGETLKSVKAGDKVYFQNKKKNILAFIIGSEPLEKGMRILGAHIDSPRLDFKENPFYERNDLAYADTHYYGGIKKYQWVTYPLALHGVVVKKDGKVIDVNIGEADDDPVVCVTDILVHLASDQLSKNGAKVVEGENLDILIGNMPLKDEEKDAVKKNVLKLLKDKYGVEEEDFLSAEIEIVPAGPAKDLGLDRSMVGGYGQDDSVCAYTSLKAILDVKGPIKYTSCCLLVDKEEIGSVGATGAESVFFENVVMKLLDLSLNPRPFFNARVCIENSKMLSSDVSAGYDPLYASQFEAKNAAFLGEGLVLNKYTGRGGKGGSNDAYAEYYAWCRNVMDSNDINWQNAELGKVDAGGGGTIAFIFGNMNMSVIDAGVPLLSMHSPFEVVSKVDVYEAYKGYIAFLKAE